MSPEIYYEVIDMKGIIFTAIIAFAIAAAAVAVIVNMLKKRKDGGCGYGCSGCSSAEVCAKKTDK